MNRICFTLILVVMTISSHSQVEFGIRGGLNLNFSKEASIIGDFNFSNNSENSLGFHIGIMTEFEIQKLDVSLRPEISFTNINYNYIDLIDFGSQSLTIKKIDVPVLIIITIRGPLRLLIGPSLEYILDTDFNVKEFIQINSGDFNLNAQMGLGLKFENFDVDLRWERGLLKAESNAVAENSNVGINFDTRPNQLILGMTYRFGIK